MPWHALVGNPEGDTVVQTELGGEGILRRRSKSSSVSSVSHCREERRSRLVQGQRHVQRREPSAVPFLSHLVHIKEGKDTVVCQDVHNRLNRINVCRVEAVGCGLRTSPHVSKAHNVNAKVSKLSYTCNIQ